MHDSEEHIASPAFTQVIHSFDARAGNSYGYVFGNGTSFTPEAGFLAAAFLDAFSAYQTNPNVLPLQIGSLSRASMRHTLSDFTVNGTCFSGGFKF